MLLDEFDSYDDLIIGQYKDDFRLLAYKNYGSISRA